MIWAIRTDTSSRHEADCGGLHRFMDWPGPILTDSGDTRSIAWRAAGGSRTGCRFRSHIDGAFGIISGRPCHKNLSLTWRCVSIISFGCSRSRCAAVPEGCPGERTRETPANGPGLFGIVQGGTERRFAQCAKSRWLLDFPATRWVVSASAKRHSNGRCAALGAYCPWIGALPDDKVGRPRIFTRRRRRGIGMFVACLPTRIGTPSP